MAFAASLAFTLGSPRVALGQTRDLRWDPAVDGTVTGVGAAVWLTSVLSQAELAPARCRWCEVDGVDRSAREALLWSHPATAGTMSNVTAFVVAPVAAVGLDWLAAAHDGSAGNIGVDTLLVLESVVIVANVNQLTKLLVGRERPFVHALPADQKAQTPNPSDNNLSFFSGHTSEAAALAASAGTVATLRGYRWAPLVWGVGGALAVTTGYLRIAADAHWLTDVLVGMLVGAGIGVGVPALFHRPEPLAATTSAGLTLPPVRGASFSFAW